MPSLKIFIFLTLSIFYLTSMDAQSKESVVPIEKTAITDTIHHYVEGYLNAKKELMTKAFYMETRLYSVDEGKIDKTEMSDWLLNIEERSHRGDIRQAKLDIDFIDVTGDTAVAKIKLIFEKFTFTDYLSLLKVDNHWIIVGKIYSAH